MQVVVKKKRKGLYFELDLDIIYIKLDSDFVPEMLSKSNKEKGSAHLQSVFVF